MQLQASISSAVESGMTTNGNPHRTFWLLRYYRWQARIYLRVLRAVWIIPMPIEAALQRRLAPRIRGGN